MSFKGNKEIVKLFMYVYVISTMVNIMYCRCDYLIYICVWYIVLREDILFSPKSVCHDCGQTQDWQELLEWLETGGLMCWAVQATQAEASRRTLAISHRPLPRPQQARRGLTEPFLSHGHWQRGSPGVPGRLAAFPYLPRPNWAVYKPQQSTVQCQ